MPALFDIPAFATSDPSGYHPIQRQLSAEWRSPSNIALVKYWGKHGLQLPMNPSVSFTLTHCFTQTSVELIPRQPEQPWVSLFVDGQSEPVFSHRVTAYFELILPIFPFLAEANITVKTSNSFPHSAGIASSASAMSALALCLTSLDEKLRKGKAIENTTQKVSYLARLGSGSASRSVYPNLAVWGQHPTISGSSDLYAIPVENFHPVFQHYQDAVLIVDASKKAISSSAGHKLMEDHPFAAARITQANENLLLSLKALEKGDLNAFIEIVELEALTLHGLMMSSSPSYTLMKEGTLSIIQTVREFRKQTGIPLCFTLDAGPNVHLLYPLHEAEKVEKLIKEELSQHCIGQKVIFDAVGDGPKRMS